MCVGAELELNESDHENGQSDSIIGDGKYVIIKDANFNFFCMCVRVCVCGWVWVQSKSRMMRVIRRLDGVIH